MSESCPKCGVISKSTPTGQCHRCGVADYGRYRALWIASRPSIAGGAPLLNETRVIDLLDRIDAGDSVEEVAEDFSVYVDSLELLIQLRDLLQADTERKFGFTVAEIMLLLEKIKGDPSKPHCGEDVCPLCSAEAKLKKALEDEETGQDR
jgi:uncharacterized protein (DUF433 family)